MNGPPMDLSLQGSLIMVNAVKFLSSNPDVDTEMSLSLNCGEAHVCLCVHRRHHAQTGLAELLRWKVSQSALVAGGAVGPKEQPEHLVRILCVATVKASIIRNVLGL